MERRSTTSISPKLKIFFSRSSLSNPPCQPAKETEVLERLYEIINEQKKNEINFEKAALQVRKKLIHMYVEHLGGDSQIPLLSIKIVKKKYWIFILISNLLITSQEN